MVKIFTGSINLFIKFSLSMSIRVLLTIDLAEMTHISVRKCWPHSFIIELTISIGKVKNRLMRNLY